MRYINILFVGLILSCNSKTDTKSIPENILKINVESLEKKGFEKYKESPIESLPIFKELAIEYGRTGNYKKAGITNLNIANIYDEHLNKIDSALAFSEKSLDIWKTQNDSLQTANILKYTGLLKGKKGQTEEAESDIRNAIRIYRDQDFAQGVSVSQFNLADVYFRNGDYKKSIHYLDRSTSFWKQSGNHGRVFTNNMLGIRIYNAIKKREKVQELIRNNKEIEQHTNINRLVKNNFDELVMENSIEE